MESRCPVVETLTAKSKLLRLHGSVPGCNLVEVKSYQTLWMGLCLACLVAPAGSYAGLTPEKLYLKTLPSVMTLEVENKSKERFVGSAVLALADDVALTAWHVIADAHSVWAVFADGQRVRVTGCIDHDNLGDLALLKLEKRMPHRQAVLCRDLQSVAARVYAIGAPKGYDFSISDGLISQIRRSEHGFLQYQVSCPISPGNSGSPILNIRGEVIGIASWTKADAQNVSFAIPAHEFAKLNVSQSPTAWNQLLANATNVSPASLLKSRQSADKAIIQKETADAESFVAFQKWFNGSLGKSVTIMALEGDRTNVYTFTVK